MPLEIGGAIAGLVVSFFAVMAIDRSAFARKRLIPRITSIVKKGPGVSGIDQAMCCHIGAHS